jgi:hypothetical protein
MFKRWNEGNFDDSNIIEIIKEVTGDDPSTLSRPIA